MAELRFILDTSDLDNPVYGLGGGPFTINATGTATLGALSATATSSVTHFATASASLDGLVSTATATVVLPATASADLGSLAGSATATVLLPATASANLGGLVASAITAVKQEAVAVASLGGLVATADSTDTPTPPEPEPTPAPSGGRRVYSTTPRKKIEPLVEMPPVEVPVIEPKKRYAVSSTVLGGMSSQATAEIAFSILDDEAELLLML